VIGLAPASEIEASRTKMPAPRTGLIRSETEASGGADKQYVMSPVERQTTIGGEASESVKPLVVLPIV
jgi:hypothetical protein